MLDDLWHKLLPSGSAKESLETSMIAKDAEKNVVGIVKHRSEMSSLGSNNSGLTSADIPLKLKLLVD